MPTLLEAEPRRLTWLRWSCTTALGLSLWCAGAALAFDLQGHRGARALAPENTLAGLERALAIGVSTLEFDVVLSADGVPMLSHDTAPNPDITRDEHGRWLQSPGQPFHRLTHEQIRRFDVGRINPATRYARSFAQQQAVDGERIPTLAEVFQLVRRLDAGHVRFNIELKRNPLEAADSPDPQAFVQAVVAVIEQFGMRRRSTLQSFDWQVLRAAQRLAPELPLSFLSAQRPRFDTLGSGDWTAGLRLQDHRDAPALVAAAGGRIWSPHHLDLDRHLLQRAREEGLRVIPWTVNEAPDMERLIDWGVDGLITDDPQRLRQVLQQRGIPLPPAVQPALTAQRASAP